MKKEKIANGLKKHIKKFYKENNVLSNLSLGAVAFIIFYYFSYDIPEVWKNASILVDILFQLSLALIANLIFFIFQVYIPSCKRSNKIQPIIQNKIKRICEDINMPFLDISRIYLGEEKNLNEFTDNDMQVIAEKYRPLDISTVQIAYECRNLTYNEYFKYCFREIDNIIEELFLEYDPYLNDDQRDILIVVKENSLRDLFDSPLMGLFDTTGIQGDAVQYTFNRYKHIYEALLESIKNNSL